MYTTVVIVSWTYSESLVICMVVIWFIFSVQCLFSDLNSRATTPLVGYQGGLLMDYRLIRDSLKLPRSWKVGPLHRVDSFIPLTVLTSGWLIYPRSFESSKRMTSVTNKYKTLCSLLIGCSQNFTDLWLFIDWEFTTALAALWVFVHGP